MKSAFRGEGSAGEVVAIVGELSAGCDFGGLPDDAIAFDDFDAAIGRADDPFASQHLDGVLRDVADGEKINKRMRRFRREIGIAMVDHLINGDPEAWQFLSGGLHVSEEKGG